MNLGDLSQEQRRELIQIYDDYDRLNRRLNELGVETTLESAKRTMRRWKSSDGDGDTSLQVMPRKSPQTVSQSQFDSYIDDIRHTERYARIMHLADIHFPYQDDAALNLAYEVVRKVQPHVIVVGSDAFDFQYLSTFESDPDTMQYDDEIELAASYWNPHIHALKDAAPQSRLIYIYGNHERRLIRYLNRNAPKMRRVVTNAYTSMIQCGGAVDYIGYTDRIWVANLLVQHGNTVQQYHAKAHLQDLAFQAHTMVGHVHRIDNYQVMGARYMAKAAGGGCLCELQPHYVKGTSMRKRWQQGTCIADLDLISGGVDFHNLTFSRDGDYMQTRLGFQTIAVDAANENRNAA